MGDAFDTWTHNGDQTGFWPNWLGSEFTNTNVWSLNHSAGAIGSILSDEGATLFQKAKTAIACMKAEGFGQRPIVFIVHSLGGLLVKKVLRISYESSDMQTRRIFDDTVGVVFLATPHDGSFLANLATKIVPLFGGKPKHVLKELKSGSEGNYELDTWYRERAADMFPINTYGTKVSNYIREDFDFI